MLKIKRKTSKMNQDEVERIGFDHFGHLVKKAITFLAFAILESNGRVFIAHHADAGGCAAAVFVYEFLRKTCPSIHFDVPPIANHEFTFRKLRDVVLVAKRKLVITLDLPIHQEPAGVDGIVGAACKMLIYDHHIQRNSVP